MHAHWSTVAVAGAAAGTSAVVTASEGLGLNLTIIIATTIGAFVAAIPPTLVAILSYLQAKEARRAAGAAEASAKAAHEQSVETAKQVDGRLSELIPMITKGAADRATLVETARKAGDPVAVSEPAPPLEDHAKPRPLK